VLELEVLPFSSIATGDSKNSCNIQNVLQYLTVKWAVWDDHKKAYLGVAQHRRRRYAHCSHCTLRDLDGTHELPASLTPVFVHFVEGDETPVSREQCCFAMGGQGFD
jgi:hypothetical protein